MLDEQLRAARLQAFVGRACELAAFRAALYDDARAFTVLYLHGPGGIGKSTLLQRFADEAHRTRRPVACLDVGADRDDLVAAYGAVRHTLHNARPIVLIDEIDGERQPERWLREVVLPAFPLGALVVVAAWQPPAVRWRTDPGWDAMLRTVPLGPLSGPEAVALLDKHRVPADRQAALLALADGNPLALRVGAQTVQSLGATDDEALHRDVAHAIFHRIVGVLPTPAHRRALEVCAHALATTEELLRITNPDADAATLFDWLRRQPYMTSDSHGVHPSDLVRTIVETEARWRDVGTFATTHLQIQEHLFDQLRSTSAETALPVMANIVFAQRHEAGVPHQYHNLQRCEVQEHRYRSSDRGPVLSMARQAEGPESARIVEYWLDRQPEAFTVYRRPGEQQAIAFFCWLQLTGPTGADLAADPVVAAAWARAQQVMPVKAGEHLSIARFWVDPASYQRPSEATDLMQLRCAATIIRDEALAWSVFVTADPGFWGPLYETVQAERGGQVGVGGREYTMFFQSWRLMARTEWSEPVNQPTPAGLPTAGAGTAGAGTVGVGAAGAGLPGVSWARVDFDLAVRRALRAWRRPDVLADSRLATSRVAAQAGGRDAVTTVRLVLSAALDTLGSEPRQAKLHRALTTTYLRGAPTQEAAAERLGLPFSTYRRHLARGHEAICDLLWKAETEGIDFTDSGQPGSGS